MSAMRSTGSPRARGAASGAAGLGERRATAAARRRGAARAGAALTAPGGVTPTVPLDHDERPREHLGPREGALGARDRGERLDHLAGGRDHHDAHADLGRVLRRW